MAGDWIKMRHSLSTEPKVLAIGRQLSSAEFSSFVTGGRSDVTLSDGALRHLVTGALHTVWCAVDAHVENDIVRGADLSWVDQVCGLPGFGKAMLAVGWVSEADGGLVFPKFCCANTSGAERQKKYRQRQREMRHKCDVTSDVTGDITSDAREEKRREEKSIKEKEAIASQKKAQFAVPTVDEIDAYCEERGNGIDGQGFFDFYESKGWMVGKNKMRDWRAAVRTWERNQTQSTTQAKDGIPAGRPLTPEEIEGVRNAVYS